MLVSREASLGRIGCPLDKGSLSKACCPETRHPAGCRTAADGCLLQPSLAAPASGWGQGVAPRLSQHLIFSTILDPPCPFTLGNATPVIQIVLKQTPVLCLALCWAQEHKDCPQELKDQKFLTGFIQDPKRLKGETGGGQFLQGRISIRKCFKENKDSDSE